LCDNLEGRFNIPSTDLDNLQYQIEDRIQHNLTFVTIPETWVDIDYNSNDICELQGDGAYNYEMGLCFYHGNHLSSTQMLTDMYGDIIQSIHYAPFGEVITEFTPYWHGGKIPDYLFNGKELDEETGMYYYEARYYNPPTFISRDPLFEKYPYMSPYAYCNNNPLKWVDPTGMSTEDPIDGKPPPKIEVVQQDRNKPQPLPLLTSDQKTPQEGQQGTKQKSMLQKITSFLTGGFHFFTSEGRNQETRQGDGNNKSLDGSGFIRPYPEPIDKDKQNSTTQGSTNNNTISSTEGNISYISRNPHGSKTARSYHPYKRGMTDSSKIINDANKNPNVFKETIKIEVYGSGKKKE
jgi:RHS repeat-associated protein